MAATSEGGAEYMSKVQSVTVAVGSIRTRDGHTHQQGATVSLPDVEARDLIRAGHVRVADPTPAVQATPATNERKVAKNG